MSWCHNITSCWVIAVMLAAGAACTDSSARTATAEARADVTSLSALELADALHGGWDVILDGDRMHLSLNRSGTWTYSSACRRRGGLGNFTTVDGVLDLIDFGVQLEAAECNDAQELTSRRFLALLSDLAVAEIDGDVLVLSSDEDSMTLMRTP